ncbi:hypothetical protein ABIA22_001496 [Sinorhizobium fredii]
MTIASTPWVILDTVQLAFEIRFILHADGLQLVVATLLGVGLGTLQHVLEEVVGERLHDEADDRLVGSGGNGRKRSCCDECHDGCEFEKFHR